MAVTNLMAINVVRVKAKPSARRRRSAARQWIILAAAVCIGAAATLWYDWYYGRLGLVAPQPIVESNAAGGRIIRVPPGGNVQAALEQANGGDIVELQAGAVYDGTINLPNKPLNDYVTIRSSTAANLPPDKRVTRAQRSSMATITSGMFGRPAVQATNGAHHYRFVGIEFTASGKLFNYGVVVLGGKESRTADVPHDIEIDRCYVHPAGSTVSRRGIAVNSAETTIKNSYIEGFGFPGEETQGVCGWNGTRNIHIINNYIEGGAENIMFGGADPSSAELIPQDIEVRSNHLNKPAEWNGKATVKTLFELKDAKRVQLVGNLLTNNWKGSAFRITVRNQDGGASFSTIEDVTIRDNIVDRAGEGINILGRDDTYPSQTLKRLTIENNLFLNLAGGNGCEGSGYFVQITDGEEITVAHNTAFNSGNITTFYGELPRRFIFHDNITGHGSYGIHGPLDVGSDAARSMFQNNIFMNLQGVSSGDYAFPDGNKIVSGIGEIGFLDTSAKDYRLRPASKYKGKGSDLPPSIIAALD
jgi:hypothetical protein